MRSVKFLFAAGAASLLSSVAFAADMPSIAAPPMYAPPPVEDFGGWYLRGDIGFSNQRVNHLDTPGYHDPGITVPPTIGLGFDTAGIVRSRRRLSVQQLVPRRRHRRSIAANPNLHGLDIVSFNGVVLGTDEYHGSNPNGWCWPTPMRSRHLVVHDAVRRRRRRHVA